MLDYLIFLAVGRIVIWFIQINGFVQIIAKKISLLNKLIQCDLCLGVWVYIFLGVIYPQPLKLFNPHAEIFLVALISSLTVHLLRIGWTYKFGILAE